MDLFKHSDEILIKGLKGDISQRNKALTQIYNNVAYRTKILGFMRSKGVKQEEAEDIFQDGIIILVKNVTKGKYDGSTPLINYLFGICRYLWFDHLRKRSKDKKVELSENRNIIEDNTPEIILVKKEKKKAVYELMKRLGEPCKTVLELWSTGYSTKEIAVRMNYTTEYSKLRIHRCKRQVEKLLDNDRELLSRLKN